jgi:hypothetical protein
VDSQEFSAKYIILQVMNIYFWQVLIINSYFSQVVHLGMIYLVKKSAKRAHAWIPPLLTKAVILFLATSKV